MKRSTMQTTVKIVIPVGSSMPAIRSSYSLAVRPIQRLSSTEPSEYLRGLSIAG